MIRKMRAAGVAMACVLAAMVSSASAQMAKHVIIVSVDGLHQADLTDPALHDLIPHVLALAKDGISYSNARGMTPSDSMPGTLAYLTGAGPATTGVYYDDTFCRTLGPSGAGGAEIKNTEEIDKNSDLLSGGGDFGAGSLDPGKYFVLPSSYLKVNTIFEVVHAAGVRTAMMDKHPAYEIAAGPSGKGVDDLYCPEISAKAALVDGKLVDSSNAPDGTKLKQITKKEELAIAYDQLKMDALIREIHSQDSRGTATSGAPGLIAFNLQAYNVSEKDKTGGIDLADGKEVPSAHLTEGLQSVDASIARLCDELHAAGLWDQTLIVLTAKHGQEPRVGMTQVIPSDAIFAPLTAAGVPVAHATLDDLAVLWLKDPAQTSTAAKAMQTLKDSPQNPGIDLVLFGDSLAAANLEGSADRTPDIIVTLKPGMVISDKTSKRSEHGGFCDDDTHVPLILAGGAIGEKSRGTSINSQVRTTQIAVTVLNALGLDASQLQGAVKEGTVALPGTGWANPVAIGAGARN